MGLENIKLNETIHNRLKKCEFCGKKLNPIGLDYLYVNISPEFIEYERCNCIKAQEYWNKQDKIEYEKQKKSRYREIINRIYKQSYMEKNLQSKNFENFRINPNNKEAIKVAKDYTEKCIKNNEDNGLIITGMSGQGKTHLASAIANKLIEQNKIVLMGRLTTLLDMIKETFRDNTKSENELIELYSNVDLIIIDDLGTEKISNWVLEKLYTIIQNRCEKGLPIVITTRFNKKGLIERFEKSQDKDLANATIEKLYQMCYGITLKSAKKELV